MPKKKIWVSMDTETYPISKDSVSPRVVCISLATRCSPEKVETDLIAACEDRALPTIQGLLKNHEVVLIGHNMAYDLNCLVSTWPELKLPILDKLEAGEVTDTLIREKLLNLSTSGNTDTAILPDGQERNVPLGLADLEKRYLGMDRSDQKTDEDAWRLRYHELDGVPADEYPREARDYAIDDAVGTLLVAEAQEVRRGGAERGPGSMNTHEFQTAVDYCLRRFTVQGIAIDREARDEMAEELGKEFAPEQFPRLIDSGILRPPVPPRPMKSQKKRVARILPDLSPDEWEKVDWTQHREVLEEAGVRFTQHKKESINQKALHAVVEAVCEENDIPLERTAKGAISASSGFIKVLAPYDKILGEYQRRQELARLVGAELPKLDADRVHPNYNILKNTGRTSSTGNRRGSEPLYPSTNIQQVDPRARNVFVPDEGHVICSVDYSSLELVTLAQSTYSLLNYSVHRDKLLAGYDLHAYLGSQLAVNLHDGFSEEARGLDADEAYALFMKKKKTDPEFYGHWRKFAKPVGLGFPGGLGAETFVTFAAGVYDVTVTHEEAKALKEIWLETYPEMVDYFEWINRYAKDPEDPLAYCYESPMGMWRARASYCATANGKALQTPSAEGAKIAIFKVLRACDTPGDLLYGTRPWGFIHDEINACVKDDELAGAKADRIAKIMVDSMQMVASDVPVGAEPALMRFWTKAAEEVRDEDGNLLVWEPKEKK